MKEMPAEEEDDTPIGAPAAAAAMCVCVCEREREREMFECMWRLCVRICAYVCVCVYLCMHVCMYAAVTLRCRFSHYALFEITTAQHTNKHTHAHTYTYMHISTHLREVRRRHHQSRATLSARYQREARRRAVPAQSRAASPPARAPCCEIISVLFTVLCFTVVCFTVLLTRARC